MPPTRQHHDPFTDAPLRPTTGNPSFRTQTSQSSLRSNISNASARPRQPQSRDLFAPALSRRPTSKTTPRVEDDVLADPDSDEDIAVVPRQRQARGALRTGRHGSPEKGPQHHGRARGVARREEEDIDIVNRQADGNYMLDVSGINEGLPMGVPQTYPSAEMEDEDASE